MDQPSPPRRWWRRIPARLSVRGLMVLVLILAGLMGRIVHLAHVQRDAVAAIERAGGKAYYDWQVTTFTANPDWDELRVTPTSPPPGPKWLFHFLGPDFLATVKLVIVRGEADPIMARVGELPDLEEVDFVGRKGAPFGPTDAGMRHLRGLTGLRNLKLGITTGGGSVGARISGVGLAAIAGATRMQYLQLDGVPLVDKDLAALRGMADLRYLSVEGPGITDAGMAHLSGLVEIRKLGLQGTGVTSAGIVPLRGMTKLQHLNLALSRVDSLETCRPLASLTELVLARTPVADAGLAASGDPGFAALTNLNLFRCRVGDEGLLRLRDLPAIRRIDVSGSEITEAGIVAFKQVRPKVNVGRGLRPTKKAAAPAVP